MWLTLDVITFLHSFTIQSIDIQLTKVLCLTKETEKYAQKITLVIQHGRYLENWYLEAGRDLGTSEADTEVGVL